MNPKTPLTTASLLLFVLLVGGTSHALADSGVTGEANFNPESGLIEVSLALDINDFRLVLADRFDRAVSINPDNAPLMQTYIEEQFSLIDQNDEKAPINWIGHEVSNGRVWVFFEMSLPQQLEGSRFRNRLHFEIPEHSSNRLDFIIEDNRLAMRFYRDDNEIALDDISLGISH